MSKTAPQLFRVKLSGWKLYLPVAAAAVLLLFTIVRGAEMVSNGIFNNSTGWTLSTATYDGSQTRTAGSGSVVVSASGRNAAASGTVTQAVSIPAGSTVSTVSLYTRLSTNTETTGDDVTVTLRYADSTTATLLDTGELTNHTTWTLRSASPALTLAQDVNQIIITIGTKAGNSSSATASLWVDELSITYAAGTDSTKPTVNSFTATTPTTASRAIPITAFTASDNITVTGYAITTSSTPPAAVNPPSGVWSTTAPTSYTVAADGTYTLYPWAEDAAGNVSLAFGSPRTVVVDTLHPTVSSTSPVNGTTGVAANSSIQVTWSENIDCATVTATDLTINGSSVGTPTCSAPTNTATFPISGQANSTLYSVAVNGVSDVNGNAMSAAYNFSYTTAAGGTCTANTPTLAVAPTSASVVAGAGMTYTATVTNNDSGATCGNVTFNLSLANSNTINFSTTTLSPSASLSIAPGGQGSASFTVTAGGAAPDGAQNVSTVGVTASGHGTPANVTATTTVNSTNSPLMHSGANLGTKYAGGTWGAGKECDWCHNTDEATNIKLVRTSIDTPTGPRAVAFNRLTAASTTAVNILGNDERTVKTVSTNVCEVCHHSTDFHQYSSVAKPSGKSILSATHNNRTDCTSSCHPHSAGFKGSGCNGCHGDPPTTTAIGGPDGLATPATGALGASPANAGAHNAHVNNRNMTCNVCHTGNTMPSVSNTIQIGFAFNAATWPSYRGNSITYGSFSGHTPLNAPYGAGGMVSSSAGTVVNNSASYRTSCNVYCHGQWAGSNGSLNASWIITNGTQDACGTCHSTSQATYAAGSHQRHTGTATASGQLNLACTECHGTLPGNNDHVNGQVHTQLNTANTKFGSSATYKGFANQSSAALSYGSCSVYCHSAVQNGTGTALATPTPTPNWGTAGPLTCSTSNCHGNPPANNAHAAHTGAPYNYACSACHNGAGQGTASHANYAINMAVNGTYGATATYTAGASVTPGSAAAFGTCNTTICHGQKSPVWGSPSAAAQCQKCHGSKATAFGTFSSPQVAPGYSTDGVDTGGNINATSARVGTHQAHLQATEGFTDKVHCGECHTVVTSVAQAAHLNYTTASMNFGPVAKAQSHTPAVTRTGGIISCSTTYCHTGKLNSGAAPTPAWNNTAYLPATISITGCSQCHGFPPSTASGHPAATAPGSFPVGGNCNCHTNLSTTSSAYGTIFSDKAKHVNGVTEYTTSCKGCHGTGTTKDVQSEFARNSHHTNKAWASITDADCVVCHAEGTIAAGTVSTVPTRHGGESGTKGVVDLYNADNRATIYSITLADLTNHVNAANATLDTFCMSCHDSGGAAAVTTGNGFTGGNVALNPFNDTTLSNSYDQQTRTFGAAPAALNVYDAFAPTNNSHHAVRSARYTKTSGLLFGQSLTQAGLLSTTAANFSGGTGFTDMSVMHCTDCHSTAYSAHGGNNEYLLQTAASENPTAEHASDTEYVCLKCHPNYTGGGTHTGSTADFIHSSGLTGTARSSGNNGHITGIACLNCHDGAVGFGGVHGVPNASYTAGVNGSGAGTYNKRRFLPGSGLRYYDPSNTHTSSTIDDDGTWGEATATNQCYTLGTANTTSSCTKHGTKAGSQNGRNVRRPATY